MNFNKKATLPWFIYTFFLILSFNISFILVLCSLNMIYLGLFCIVFSKIPGLVACFLSLFLENSYSSLQIFCTHYVYVEASLRTQTVKNLSAMQENQVWSLAREDPLEKGIATHCSVLPGEFQGQRTQEGYGFSKTWLSDSLFHLPTLKEKTPATPPGSSGSL